MKGEGFMMGEVALHGQRSEKKLETSPEDTKSGPLFRLFADFTDYEPDTKAQKERIETLGALVGRIPRDVQSELDKHIDNFPSLFLILIEDETDMDGEVWDSVRIALNSLEGKTAKDTADIDAAIKIIRQYI